MSVRNLLIALLGLVLLAAPPARADSIHFKPVSYDGVFQGLVPGGVAIRTPWGSVLLPEGLSFSVAGQRVEITSLAYGSPLRVLVPGGSGTVVGGSGEWAFVQFPSGVFPLPGACLPGDLTRKAKVTVLKPNGKTVRVPLEAALNMQRAQGAAILGPGALAAWPSGLGGPTVVVGGQGEHLLLQALVGGTPRLFRVPRGQAAGLAGVAPGTVVDVTPQGKGLGHKPWTPGPGKGTPPGKTRGEGHKPPGGP